MPGYSGPRLRPAPDSPALALSDARSAPAEDPGPAVDHYIVHEGLSPFRGFPRETDDGEVLDGHPDRGIPGPADPRVELAPLPMTPRKGGPEPTVQTRCPRCRKAVLTPAKTELCVTYYDPASGGGHVEHACRPGADLTEADRPVAPGELAHDIMGVQVEINLIAAHLPEVAALVGRLVPGAPVPGGLVRKLGTLRARTATAAAGLGAVVRDLTGPAPEPTRGVVAGVRAGDALGELIASLMKEMADLLGDRRCEADWDQGKRDRLRSLGEAIAIVAGAKA